MTVKFCTVLFLAAAISFSQDPVGLSGTVFDSYSNKPVKGASVSLVGMNISIFTDTNGFFALSRTDVTRRTPSQTVYSLRFLGKQGFLFNNESVGNIQIRVHTLSGRQGPVIYSGKLTAGSWRFFPPRLAPGLYLCRVNTPKKQYSTVFFSPESIAEEMSRTPIKIGESVNGTNSTFLSRKSATPGMVDSLRVAKGGYYKTIIPLDSLIKTGLKIYVTDTSAHTATIVPDPSWTCGMPAGIPPPLRGTLVFTATLQLEMTQSVGITPYGHRRFHIVKSGTISGNRIQAAALAGGLELELKLPNGSVELEEIHVLRTSDKTLIFMRNGGVAPAGDTTTRVVPDFEAPNASSFAWLNTGKFAANRVVNTAAGTIRLDVYDVSAVALPDPQIQIRDPQGVPNQSWECAAFSGIKGVSVFTETVTLGASLTIGASKRGSRNIIPITGGTTTGLVTGSILAAGGDYQLSVLDARYVLAPSNGEFIVVRNCGPFDKLVPQFEAKAGGLHAFLNTNRYLSSAPVVSGNSVSITFSERN